MSVTSKPPTEGKNLQLLPGLVSMGPGEMRKPLESEWMFLVLKERRVTGRAG